MNDENSAPRSEGSWEEETTGYAELGDLLRSGVRDGEDGAGAELRSAWAAFVDASRSLGQAIAATAGDPEVRASVKEAVQSAVATVGAAAADAAETAAATVRKTAERTRGATAAADQDTSEESGADDPDEQPKDKAD